MKKLIAVLLVAVMAVSLFAACSGNNDKPADPTEAPATEVPATEVPATEVPATEVPVTEVPATPEPEPVDNTVNLLDMYSVTDPEGVEYDQRTVLYTEVTEEYDETMYAAGIRHDFCVLYGKDGQGVYMYEVMVFETEEQAAAYAETEGASRDGVCTVLESDASFFEMMSAFIPDLQAYIDMMLQMGMTELN